MAEVKKVVKVAATASGDTNYFIPEPKPGWVTLDSIKNGQEEGKYFTATEDMYKRYYSDPKKFVLKKKSTR